MAWQWRQLAQVRPGVTTPVVALTMGAGKAGIVRGFRVTNTSGVGDVPLFRLFHDNDGAVYDESTALYWDVPVHPGVPFENDGLLCLAPAAGNLAVRTSIISVLTFTFYGYNEDE